MTPDKPSFFKDPPQTPKTGGAERSYGSAFDVKRVAQVVVLLVVVVTVAIWAIGRTFTPGSVTRLEPAEPAYVDYGPPAPEAPAKPEVRRAPAPPPAPEPPAAPATPFSANVPPPRVQPPRPAGSVIPVAPITRPAPAPREARLPPPELRFETFEEVMDSAIYSSRDPDVDPPVVLYPQTLGRVPLGVRQEDLAYVEVVINEEGRVLRVKAQESPQTLDESMVITMSLSAAKTWRFQPARKDGRAVKYRQVLPVSLR